jgi:hypothetical protein
VFQSEKTGEPLENGRHWFDNAVIDAVIEAGIKNFRWHDLATYVCEPVEDEGNATKGHCGSSGAQKFTMTRQYAHLGPNKLWCGVSAWSNNHH